MATDELTTLSGGQLISRASSQPRETPAELAAEIHACRRCPRLVEWREALRRRPAAPLPRRGLLGAAAGWLRRPAGPDRDRRPRPRRPRRQPHRPHVHRRPLRRVALRRPAPGRARQPARVGAPRRRAAPHAAPTSPRSSAAPLPPTGRPRPSATTASPTWSASWRCSSSCRVVVALGAFAWDGALRALRALGAEVPRPRPQLRPRRRGRRRAAGACSAATTRASRTPSPAG